MSHVTTEPCFHCGLPIEETAKQHAVIQGAQYSFCCSGCALVCETIHESGLSGFYDKLKTSEALAPPPETDRDIDQFDLEDVQADFVTCKGELSEATLLVEGIHCAACVWLIEHALAPLEGVKVAEVNLAHHRLKLSWNQQQTPLSTILKRLAQLGYKAVPYNLEAAEGAEAKRHKSLLYRMAFAGFGAMNIMWISIALFAGASSASGIDSDYKQFFHIIGFLIATPVLFYSGWPIIMSAVKSLRYGQLGMDLPVAIGATATYAYSTWITYIGEGDVYFDTVVAFLFIILVGRYLEGLSRKNATSSTQRLMELQPRSALRYVNGETERVSVRALRLGDQVMIRPGDKVPVDGRVIEGHSEISEAMLTGEAEPVIKNENDKVIAGTVNGQGALVVQVEQLGNETTLAKIVHMVESAQGSKAPIQCTADKIVPWFVAATLGLALITFIYWFKQDFDIALLAATSVLIITCPCAFGLATPMGIAVSVGHASKHGVLIKNGSAIEVLSGVTEVVFDKTGTLTEGRLAVSKIVLHNNEIDESRLLSLVAAAEARSEHHIAHAIVEYAKQQGGFKSVQLDSFSSVPGRGVQALVSGHTLLIGNEALLQDHGIELPEAMVAAQFAARNEAHVAVLVAIDGQVAGLISVQDKIRDEAFALVAELRQRGIKVSLLTGDSQAAADKVAKQLGGMNVIAEVLPQHKDQVIVNLQKQGERVVMIGDGVNDAPALTRADVGIAMGSGTDVSMDCADFVLMDNDLNKILFAIDLASQTLATIRQNIKVSLAYNVILVPLAMAAVITPVFAAIAMPLSSLAVIGNALRIRRLCRPK